MKQYGFSFTPGLCIGCGSCQFACREENHLMPNTYFRRVLTLEPEDSLGYIGFFSAGCNHCQNPACIEACQNGAMQVSEVQGVVIHDSGRCIGCSACVWACPYGAVVIDPRTGKSGKCTSCLPRRNQGLSPACVSACPTKALQFGPLEQLEGEAPDSRLLPDGGASKPSLRIRRLPQKEVQP